MTAPINSVYPKGYLFSRQQKFSRLVSIVSFAIGTAWRLEIC